MRVNDKPRQTRYPSPPPSVAAATEGLIVVLVTAPNKAEASRLASRLVRERLAACVSVAPSVRSTYWWKDRVERTDECLLVIKTLSSKFSRLNRRIHEMHSYTVPEVLALPVIRGSAPYLTWMRRSLRRR